MRKLTKKAKKILAIVSVASVIACVLAVSCSAAVASDASTFIASVTGAMTDLSTTNLASVLVAALGITVSLFICWFAYRFIVRKVSGALRGGRL